MLRSNHNSQAGDENDKTRNPQPADLVRFVRFLRTFLQNLPCKVHKTAPKPTSKEQDTLYTPCDLALILGVSTRANSDARIPSYRRQTLLTRTPGRIKEHKELKKHKTPKTLLALIALFAQICVNPTTVYLGQRGHHTYSSSSAM
jgi:hypothetical protein